MPVLLVHLPRWAIMWLVAFAFYFACKLLTWVVVDRREVAAWKQLAYLFAWVGMDAKAFFKPINKSASSFSRISDWLWGFGNLLLGIFLVWGISPLFYSTFYAAWLAMVGMILMLHFGLFQLLSCAWLSVGFDAKPLMKSPILSTNLADFWGRRWNTSFRKLTYDFFFKPLTRMAGPKFAVFFGFLASGIVHDIVISFPAGSGYGKPTLYFIIQGSALLLQRSSWSIKHRLQQEGLGRILTFCVIVLPLNLLFHRAFLEQIIIPFLHAIRAR